MAATRPASGLDQPLGRADAIDINFNLRRRRGQHLWACRPADGWPRLITVSKLKGKKGSSKFKNSGFVPSIFQLDSPKRKMEFQNSSTINESPSQDSASITNPPRFKTPTDTMKFDRTHKKCSVTSDKLMRVEESEHRSVEAEQMGPNRQRPV